ncbi:hypothetical protein WJX73_001721 [Symbiochloris irregularis]|uniref:SAP domain-containing protein n=1 Tax=Symbiochloris irregularis TaxID=706552 RepID=A0AAW1Q2B0_9CHLO
MGTDWNALKVVELKEELKSRGLHVSGKKAELITRLEEYEATQEAEQPEEKESPVAAGTEKGVKTATPAASSEAMPPQGEISRAPSTQAVITGPAPSQDDTLTQRNAAHPTASLDTQAVGGTAASIPPLRQVDSDVSAPSTAISAANQDHSRSQPRRQAAERAAASSPAPAPASPAIAAQAPAVSSITEPPKTSPSPTRTTPPAASRVKEASPQKEASPVKATAGDVEMEEVDYGEAPEPLKESRGLTPPVAASQDAAKEGASRAATGKLSAGLAARLGGMAASPNPPAETKKRDREASTQAEEGGRAKASKVAADDVAGKDASAAAADKAAPSKRAPIQYIRREPSGSGAETATPRAAALSNANASSAGRLSGAGDAGQAFRGGSLGSRVSDVDKRVSVFAGRLSGNVAEQVGEGGAAQKAPATRQEASRALCIDGFKRPFTDKAAHEYLSQFGQVVGMKFGMHKKNAYVLLKTVAEAEATRDATWAQEWPPDNKGSLRPKFVPEQEAAAFIGIDLAAPPAEGISVIAPPVAAPVEAPPQMQAEEPAQKEKVIEIDFMSFWKNKTKAEPMIYWAPLTEEQIKAKALAAAEKQAKQAVGSAEKLPKDVVEGSRANGVTADVKERARERSSRK